MKLLLLILLLGMFTIQEVNAAAIGVSRAELKFTDVLKGGYAEDDFVVTTDSDNLVTVTYKFEGEIADWMTITSPDEINNQIIINQQDNAQLIVITEPPANIANGVYNGVLRVSADNIARTEGQFGSVVQAAFRIRIEITVTGRQIQSCIVGGGRISDTEVNDNLELIATIKNTGNVNIQPTFEINIWDQTETKLLETITHETTSIILPTQQKTLFELLDNNLEISQYFADIKSEPCEAGNYVTFDVVDVGDVADKGEIIRLYHQPWAESNDIIPINADFRNYGERSVEAKLQGTILLNNKVVKVIDTDAVIVRPGDTVTLQTFFQPEVTGQYFIKVRALYNSKLTFEKESLVNVNPGEEERLNKFKITWYPIVILILVIIALTLFFMIKKHPKKRRRF